MEGYTGDIQGMKGTLFGEPYEAGSWQDKLIEAFGGSHDYLGGQVTGLYDGQVEKAIHNRLSEIALLPSAPFAAATMLPPEVWKAISILLGATK